MDMTTKISGPNDVLRLPFPPVERAPADEIQRAVGVLEQTGLLPGLLEATGVAVMVLNPERQILLASGEARRLAREAAALQGLRPGEAFGCIHAARGQDGCGSGEHCRSCGAAVALMQSMAGQEPSVGECLLTCSGETGQESLEYEVKATALESQGQSYTVVAFRDISARKRREALERIFFHDVLNTIGALKGYSQLLGAVDLSQQQQINGRIERLVNRLLQEVTDQRTLSEAESGTLSPRREPVWPAEVLAAVARMYEQQAEQQDKRIEVCSAPADREVITDPSLLIRILANMTKNALEATGPGALTRLSSRHDASSCVFGVWNPGCISPEVARQIFVRSFSTKGGQGRGLGTYSMKLLGERYLGGQVCFTTSEEAGTEFCLQLSLDGPPRG
jgi:hypothetical protein